MKQFAYGLIVFAALAGPARATSCAEGMEVIERISGTLDLSKSERSKVTALIAKAKLEDRQGHERNCKIAAASAIRFLLVKAVID